MNKVIQPLKNFYHSPKVRETAAKALKNGAKAMALVIVGAAFDNAKSRKKK